MNHRERIFDAMRQRTKFQIVISLKLLQMLLHINYIAINPVLCGIEILIQFIFNGMCDNFFYL